jgi:hypothetical protein
MRMLGVQGGERGRAVRGLTANGDCIVSDPAGDYFSSDAGHYGKGKCGSNTIYPKGVTDDRLENADGTIRPALAVQSQVGANPAYLLVTGRSIGTGALPYDLWVQDASGARAGFLPDGRLVQDIGGSEVRLDPQYPSDPEAPSMAAPNSTDGPQEILLPLTQDPGTLTISVQGRLAADYNVEVELVQNGTSSIDAFHAGHVDTNQTLTFPVQTTQAPATAGFPWAVAGIAAALGATVAAFILLYRRRRRGPPPVRQEQPALPHSEEHNP